MKDIGQVVWIDRYVWNEVKKIQLDHVKKEQETESVSLTGTCVSLFHFQASKFTATVGIQKKFLLHTHPRI